MGKVNESHTGRQFVDVGEVVRKHMDQVKAQKNPSIPRAESKATGELSDAELSVRVAVDVMGFRRETNGSYRHPATPFAAYTTIPPHKAKGLPDYATDISAAMQVIEKLREQYLIRLWVAQCWNVEFWKDEIFVGGHSSDSLPRSICLAALQATAGAAPPSQ